MKDHYDFSQGKRGQFYNKDAEFRAPIDLDQTVETCLAAKASARGIEPDELVNELLRKDVELIDITR